MKADAISITAHPTHAHEYSVEFAWNTQVADLPELKMKGRLYLPLSGNRIDPDLAAARADSALFSAAAKRPQYLVTYVPSNSIAIATLGRMQ